jgi:epoxide hydrolase-like predicted phosphatase
MKEEIWGGYEWNTEMMEFILSLKPKYKTGVISDAWSGTREGMKDIINSDIFDVIVFSAEEGVQKPDPEIYYRALTQLGIAPGEAIFVDDRERNVEGAREVGMHAVVFTDNAQAKEEIERLLNG